MEFISAFFRAQQVINTSPDRVDKAMLSEKNFFFVNTSVDTLIQDYIRKKNQRFQKLQYLNDQKDQTDKNAKLNQDDTPAWAS